MSRARCKSLFAVAMLVAVQAVSAAPADDGCVDFKWDVSKERALFAGTPTALTSGKDAQSAPTVVPNRLYKFRLLAQDLVAFAASPARQAKKRNVYAGLAVLKISTSGSYRISVDLPFWIDIVSNGTLVAARDYQGQHACRAPHKIVEFELTGAQPFVLQFSNGVSDSVLLTVTPAPARKL